MKAVLFLGCEGFINQEMVFCNGISNPVLDLETISHTENYKKLIQYLDHIKLFERNSFSVNVATGCMFRLFDFGYLSESKYKAVCDFCQQHARCCLRLELKLKKGE